MRSTAQGETEMSTSSELFPIFSELHEPRPAEPKLASVVTFAKRPAVKRPRRKHKQAEPYQSKSERASKREQKEISYYGGEEPLSLQKAILAIAYLLDWYPGDGDVFPGPAANGFAPLLEKCAKDAGDLFTVDDVRKAGGDVRMLLREGRGK
jgi:hypothetical protein